MVLTSEGNVECRLTIRLGLRDSETVMPKRTLSLHPVP